MASTSLPEPCFEALSATTTTPAEAMAATATTKATNEPSSSDHSQNERSKSSSPAIVNNKDYDLTTPLSLPTATTRDSSGANAIGAIGAIGGGGLRQNLTSYGDAHFSLFMRKLFIKAMGYSEDALSRPIVGIVNTYSSFNPCHANIPQLIDAVKRGVQLNGGLAMDFPTISLHESFASPTSMYLRNLMSMDTEEMVGAQPVDAVVLIGGMYLC